MQDPDLQLHAIKMCCLSQSTACAFNVLLTITCCCRYTWQGTSNLDGTVQALHASGSALCTASTQQQPGKSGAAPERKEKSLGMLAQKFVQMLLCAPGHAPVALEESAKSLLGTFKLD